METFLEPKKIVATKGFFGPRTTPTKVAFGTKNNVVVTLMAQFYY
jgi:hypothetical protein